NGPSSQSVYEMYKACDPDLDFSQVNQFTVDYTLYTYLIPCFEKNGLDFDHFAEVQPTLYSEAIRHDPLYFFKQILQNASFATSFPVTVEPVRRFEAQFCNEYSWCDAITAWANRDSDIKDNLSQ